MTAIHYKPTTKTIICIGALTSACMASRQPDRAEPQTAGSAHPTLTRPRADNPRQDDVSCPWTPALWAALREQCAHRNLVISLEISTDKITTTMSNKRLACGHCRPPTAIAGLYVVVSLTPSTTAHCRIFDGERR